MRGCGPHRAALARGGKRAKIEKNSRANSDCNGSMFAYNKNKALRLQRARSYCNNVASLAVCYSLPRFSNPMA